MMDLRHGGGEPPVFDAYGQTAEFQMILAAAEALREEFGVSIDAHPGGEGNEAGQVNRAFRAAAGVILGGIITLGCDPAAILTWSLRQVALRRLADLGVTGNEAEVLLDSEPCTDDAWFSYLALAPITVISDLLDRKPGQA